MPAAVWIPAAIAAAGSTTGAVLSSRATNRATRAQSESTDRALQYEERREQQRRADELRREDLERVQWEAREARKAEILARYGRGYTPRPYAPGSSTSTPSPTMTMSSRGPTPTSYGEYEPLTPPLTPPAPRSTFGRIGSWDL